MLSHFLMNFYQSPELPLFGELSFEHGNGLEKEDGRKQLSQATPLIPELIDTSLSGNQTAVPHADLGTFSPGS